MNIGCYCIGFYWNHSLQLWWRLNQTSPYEHKHREWILSIFICCLVTQWIFLIPQLSQHRFLKCGFWRWGPRLWRLYFMPENDSLWVSEDLTNKHPLRLHASFTFLLFQGLLVSWGQSLQSHNMIFLNGNKFIHDLNINVFLSSEYLGICMGSSGL